MPAESFVHCSEAEKKDVIAALADALFSLTQIYQNDLTTNQVGWNNDAVEDVEVGYLKDDSVDSTYAENLRSENFSMTFEEALGHLETRFQNTFNFQVS